MAPVKCKIQATYIYGEIREPSGVKNAPNIFKIKISLVLTTALSSHFAASTGDKYTEKGRG